MTEESSAPSTTGSAAPGAVALETGTAPTGTRDAWVEAAAGVLRKSRRLRDDDPATEEQVLALLARRTPDGLTVPALGNRTDLADTDNVQARRGTDTTDGWDIRVAVIDPDPAQARAALLADLEGGANSGWLRVGAAGITPEQLATVLEPVLLDIAPVVLDIRDTDPVAAVEAFAAVFADRSLTPAPGTSFGLDPLGAALRSGAPADLDKIGEIASRATTLGVGAIVVDGTTAHDAGATDAQEIGWTLAAGVAYLRALAGAGIDPATAAGLIDFRYAVTVEQFSSIAKLRAARQLWARVLQVCGIGPDGITQRQHAVTSRPMTTRYDPWVNMLRTTIAAFAGGTGGAQSVTVLPFDSALGIPDAFGRRIARNVSHLLVGESHVAAVADPAGGAPAIERLTSELAAAGWAEFGRIEQAGGAAAASADGSVAGRIAESRDRRAERVATRKQPLTGVSEFPNLDETLPTRRSADGAETGVVAAWAAPFEQLRDAPASSPVFLATLGPVAAHSTRAGFAANALAAGGITTVQAGPTTGVDDVVAAYRAAAGELPVVCLAGTDAAYADTGPATVEALRAAGARAVLLAGRPGSELVDLIDDRIALGDDIVALSHRIRGYLEEAKA